MKIHIKALLLDLVTLGFVVFALAAAVARPSPEQWLDLSFVSMWVIGCGFVAALAALGFLLGHLKTLGHAVFGKETSETARHWLTTFWGWQLVVTFLLALVAAVRVTHFSFFELLSEDGFQGAQRIFMGLASPNWEVLPRGLSAVVETIFIAFLATVLAIPGAFVLAFFCAKNVMGGSSLGFGIYISLRTILNVVRSIEPLIWAIIFSVWVGIGPFAGMLALMLHSIASLTKQYSELIECVEQGPIEGVQSTGANTLQVLWHGVVPQIVLPYVAFTIYRWDINVRMATVIGIVGGGGIGTMLLQYQGQAQWNEVGALVVLIALVVWFMDTGSAYVREAIK